MNKIESAIELAARAHEGQVRKGTDLPYVSHPYTVGMMLARAGCDEEVIAAGILHDTVEDTHVTLDQIRRDFGEHVAAIVEGCSEPDKTATWEERKRHTLEYLAHAPLDIRVVSAADKLHNIRTVADEFDRVGDAVWSRFKRGRAEQEWYYRGLVDVLCSGDDIPFCRDLRHEVERVFGNA